MFLYILLFACANTRDIHLDLTEALNLNETLPFFMFSDNAKNCHAGAINLQVGQFGRIRDENKSKLLWPLGLVTETFAGPDGNIISLLVKTATGELKRSLQCLHSLKCLVTNKITYLVKSPFACSKIDLVKTPFACSEESKAEASSNDLICTPNHVLPSSSFQRCDRAEGCKCTSIKADGDSGDLTEDSGDLTESHLATRPRKTLKPVDRYGNPIPLVFLYRCALDLNISTVSHGGESVKTQEHENLEVTENMPHPL